MKFIFTNTLPDIVIYLKKRKKAQKNISGTHLGMLKCDIYDTHGAAHSGAHFAELAKKKKLINRFPTQNLVNHYC